MIPFCCKTSLEEILRHFIRTLQQFSSFRRMATSCGVAFVPQPPTFAPVAPGSASVEVSAIAHALHPAMFWTPVVRRRVMRPTLLQAVLRCRGWIVVRGRQTRAKCMLLVSTATGLDILAEPLRARTRRLMRPTTLVLRLLTCACIPIVRHLLLLAAPV